MKSGSIHGQATPRFALNQVLEKIPLSACFVEGYSIVMRIVFRLAAIPPARIRSGSRRDAPPAPSLDGIGRPVAPPPLDEDGR